MNVRQGTHLRGGALTGLLVTTVAGCVPADVSIPVATLRHEIDTTGSIVQVRNSGVPPQWDLEVILTVGSEAVVGEPAPDEFGRITSVTTDRRGNLWVADQMNHEVKVFGPDGSHVRTIGREGQGPGEFLSVYSIAWTGDVLLVLDLGNGRVTELSQSGELLGTRPAPGRLSGSPALLRFYAVSDTTVYQWSFKSTGTRLERVWVEHDPRGVTAEWPQLRPEAPEPTGVMCDRPDGGISFFSTPFTGKILQHPVRRGMTYVAWTREYRISLIDAEGDTVRVIERDRPGIPIEDAEWEAAASEFEEFREEWPGAKCEPRALIRPDTKPAFKNLLVDTSGRLWVEAYTDSGLVWEVFDRDGLLEAVIPGFEYVERVAPSIRGDLVAWVEADSLGVQRVRVARIQTSPPS